MGENVLVTMMDSACAKIHNLGFQNAMDFALQQPTANTNSVIVFEKHALDNQSQCNNN